MTTGNGEFGTVPDRVGAGSPPSGYEPAPQELDREPDDPTDEHPLSDAQARARLLASAAAADTAVDPVQAFITVAEIFIKSSELGTLTLETSGATVKLEIT